VVVRELIVDVDHDVRRLASPVIPIPSVIRHLRDVQVVDGPTAAFAPSGSPIR
jgi:hypothetical protein